MKRGFTLVETLVALCLLGVGASVMVAPLYKYARSQGSFASAQARNGIMERELDRIMATSYDSLPQRAGCTAVARQPLEHTRCISVVNTGTSRRRVTIIITPAAATVRADTVTVERADS